MPDEEDPRFSDGPSLDADGRLIKRFEPAPAPPEPPEVSIELKERSPKRIERAPDTYRPEPPPPPRWGLRIGLGLAVLLGAVVGVVAWRAPGLVYSVGRVRHSVVVTSDPSGATIRIGQTVVGETPWAADNVWGNVDISVELKGYQRWTGTLSNDRDVTLSAHLKRR